MKTDLIPMSNLCIAVVVLLVIVCAVIMYIAKHCFDDDDPDMFWYDNYDGCHEPYVALKNHCDHTGDKTLVNESSAVNCETVLTICDDCGKILKRETDCR